MIKRWLKKLHLKLSTLPLKLRKNHPYFVIITKWKFAYLGFKIYSGKSLILIIISMKYYCDIYQPSVDTLLIYRESKKMAITFKFLSLDFFLMLEVGLTTSNTIFSLIFWWNQNVFVLLRKLSSLSFQNGYYFLS